MKEFYFIRFSKIFFFYQKSKIDEEKGCILSGSLFLGITKSPEVKGSEICVHLGENLKPGQNDTITNILNVFMLPSPNHVSLVLRRPSGARFGCE